MSECRCGRPTRDTLTMCDTCADSLSKALGEVPWVVDELNTTITRQRAIPTEGSASNAETALPWHEKAGDALRDLKALLVSWALFCEAEAVQHQSPRREPLSIDDDSAVALSRWLLWRVDGLARHEIGPDAVDEITDAVANCVRMIDRRPDRWYAGPCINLVDEGECGADLYAKRQTGDVKCRKCGAVYDVAERREFLLAEAEDRLADASTLARAVSWLGTEPLTAARVRKWAERGRIVSHGHDGRRPLYRIGDAIDLLAGGATRSA